MLSTMASDSTRTPCARSVSCKAAMSRAGKSQPSAAAVPAASPETAQTGKGGVKLTRAEREREIVTLRYGLGGRMPRTQREIAKKLGISRSYVSRIEKRALEKLEEAIGERG